jgi:hypothetical protein
MVEWLALIVFLILVGWTLHESFDDTPTPQANTKVTRPSLESADWKSKIDSQVPLGSNDEDYVRILQAFYDNVYMHTATGLTTNDIETFLKGPDVHGKPVDPGALRMIISSGFRIDPPSSAAAREEKQIKFVIDPEALEPKDGRDEVFTREEETYRPADTRIGDLPEGRYAPVVQQPRPRRPGESNYKTTGWTQSLFYDVCSVTKKPGCEENVL